MMTTLVDTTNSEGKNWSSNALPESEEAKLSVIAAAVTEQINVKAGSLEIVTRGPTLASGVSVLLDGKPIKALRRIELIGDVKDVWRCRIEFFPNLGSS